jgi:hypothetical protein
MTQGCHYFADMRPAAVVHYALADDSLNPFDRNLAKSALNFYVERLLC